MLGAIGGALLSPALANLRIRDDFLTRAKETGELVVEFSQGSPTLFLLEQGWSSPEQPGVWSTGTTAVLRLVIPDPESAWLATFTCYTLAADTDNPVVSVRKSNSETIDWRIPVGRWTRRELCLEPGDSALLTFTIPHACCPADLGSSSDKRLLGLLLKKVVLKRMAGDQRGAHTEVDGSFRARVARARRRLASLPRRGGERE
jgi:hypothetical protein